MHGGCNCLILSTNKLFHSQTLENCCLSKCGIYIDSYFWIEALLSKSETFVCGMNCHGANSIPFEVKHSLRSILRYELDITSSLITDDIFVNVANPSTIVALCPPLQ